MRGLASLCAVLPCRPLSRCDSPAWARCPGRLSQQGQLAFPQVTRSPSSRAAPRPHPLRWQREHPNLPRGLAAPADAAPPRRAPDRGAAGTHLSVTGASLLPDCSGSCCESLPPRPFLLFMVTLPLVGRLATAVAPFGWWLMKKQARLGLISTSPHFGVCVSLLPWSSRGPVPAGRTRRAGERRGGACVPERCFTSSQSLPLTCKVVLIRSRLAAAAAAPDSQQATAPGGGTTLSHAAQPPEWCPPVRSAAAQDGVVVAIVDGVGVCVVARGSSRHAAGGENRRVRPARNGGRTRRR
jgi:hypothetical protein